MLCFDFEAVIRGTPERGVDGVGTGVTALRKPNRQRKKRSAVVQLVVCVANFGDLYTHFRRPRKWHI